jgi:hypothetical protein
MPGIQSPPREQFSIEGRPVHKLPSETHSEVSSREGESVPSSTAAALAQQFFPNEGHLETSNRRAALRALIEESGVLGEVLEGVLSHMAPDFRQGLLKLVDEYLCTMRSVSSDKHKRSDAVRSAFVTLVQRKLT